MLYKYPGKHPIHGDFFDYLVCRQNEMDKYLADGWFLTTTEAKEDFEKGIEECAEEMDEAPVPEEDRFLYTDKLPEPEPAKTIPPSRLTDAQKSNIRIAEGTQREIAKKFNVSTFTVSRIKNGKIK